MNKAFNFIGDNYIKKKIIIHNDLIILFALFQMANSYQYIKEIGYYYIRNNKNSTVNSWNNPKIKPEIIKSLFLNIQFLYEKTKDIYLDKYFCIFKIQNYFKIYNQLFFNSIYGLSQLLKYITVLAEIIAHNIINDNFPASFKDIFPIEIKFIILNHLFFILLIFYQYFEISFINIEKISLNSIGIISFTIIKCHYFNH